MRTRPSRFSLILALLSFCVPPLSQSQSQPANSAAARSYYLRDILAPHDYTPGKNSFLIQNLRRGERKVLLDLPGAGSIRHVWSTWSVPGDSSDIPAPGRALLRIFVDGEASPSISGPLDQLFNAAAATRTRYVPFPAFNYKGAFNLYLPVFFANGIRIEIEADGDLQEFYAQIDYRLAKSSSTSGRLISETTAAGLKLKYTGDVSRLLPKTESVAPEGIRKSVALNYGHSPAQLTIPGPGILRRLEIRGASLSDLELELYWDNEHAPAVRAPIQYLFADFNNIAMESSADHVVLFLPMPFRRSARVALRSLSGSSGHVQVNYSLQKGPVPANSPYFHAQYSAAQNTNGYQQFPVLRVQGEGLFVGMNLFDSGHNHGGGDAALIDAGTSNPHVLHGICGEDYFGFAWHKTGTMTPLTGAPAHERRYRLHLENPYPFHESLQLLFGVFAGQHPKSVALWYQFFRPRHSDWRTFDIPWTILGPADERAPLPDAVSDSSLATAVTVNVPVQLVERWEDSEMHAGFLDSTYQFRHYVMTERGTGFVAGRGKSKLITYVFSPSAKQVRTILGHDDEVSVELNRVAVGDFPSEYGFAGRALTLHLHQGWNRLAITVHNDENVNWRWNGLSLAFQKDEGADLKFASEPPELPSR